MQQLTERATVLFERTVASLATRHSLATRYNGGRARRADMRAGAAEARDEDSRIMFDALKQIDEGGIGDCSACVDQDELQPRGPAERTTEPQQLA